MGLCGVAMSYPEVRQKVDPGLPVVCSNKNSFVVVSSGFSWLGDSVHAFLRCKKQPGCRGDVKRPGCALCSPACCERRAQPTVSGHFYFLQSLAYSPLMQLGRFCCSRRPSSVILARNSGRAPTSNSRRVSPRFFPRTSAKPHPFEVVVIGSTGAFKHLMTQKWYCRRYNGEALTPCLPHWSVGILIPRGVGKMATNLRARASFALQLVIGKSYSRLSAMLLRLTQTSMLSQTLLPPPRR